MNNQHKHRVASMYRRRSLRTQIRRDQRLDGASREKACVDVICSMFREVDPEMKHVVLQWPPIL